MPNQKLTRLILAHWYRKLKVVLNILHINFFKSGQLLRLTVLVLEKWSPSNPITTCNKLAKISLYQTTQWTVNMQHVGALNSVLTLPAGWQSPDICRFNWLIRSLSNRSCSLFLSSKQERGMSGNNIRTTITQSWIVMYRQSPIKYDDWKARITKRILSEKGKWHISTSTRGRTSRRRWGSALSNMDL